MAQQYVDKSVLLNPPLTQKLLPSSNIPTITPQHKLKPHHSVSNKDTTLDLIQDSKIKKQSPHSIQLDKARTNHSANSSNQSTLTASAVPFQLQQRTMLKKHLAQTSEKQNKTQCFLESPQYSSDNVLSVTNQNDKNTPTVKATNGQKLYLQELSSGRGSSNKENGLKTNIVDYYQSMESNRTEFALFQSSCTPIKIDNVDFLDKIQNNDKQIFNDFEDQEISEESSVCQTLNSFKIHQQHTKQTYEKGAKLLPDFQSCLTSKSAIKTQIQNPEESDELDVTVFENSGYFDEFKMGTKEEEQSQIKASLLPRYQKMSNYNAAKNFQSNYILPSHPGSNTAIFQQIPYKRNVSPALSLNFGGQLHLNQNNGSQRSSISKFNPIDFDSLATPDESPLSHIRAASRILPTDTIEEIDHSQEKSQNSSVIVQEFSDVVQSSQSNSQAEDGDQHKQHLIQTIQSLLYLQTVTKSSIIQYGEHKNIDASPNSRLLIFDLDETLIHCFDADSAPMSKPYPSTQIVSIRLKEGNTISASVNVRPFVRECLIQSGTRYHVGIFTASSKDYADAMIDQVLDPKGELIKFRLYREHCLQTADGIYIKDLSVIKSHPLSQILIVDNSVHSFGFQLPNGIPILPFFDDSQDQELVHLASYVLSLSKTENFVSNNSKTFKLNELKSGDLTGYLLEQNQWQESGEMVVENKKYDQCTITEEVDEDEQEEEGKSFSNNSQESEVEQAELLIRKLSFNQ